MAEQETILTEEGLKKLEDELTIFVLKKDSKWQNG